MASIAHSINSTDRLGVTLLAAVVLHAVIILGIVFDQETPRQENSEQSLDIIVVRNPQQPIKENKQADFLAQQSQQGGGELKEKARLTSPPSKPTINPKPVKQVELLPSQADKAIKEKQTVTVKQAKTSTAVKKPETKPVKKAKKINMDQLLASTQQEINLLTAEIDIRQQNQSKQPRRKYINSSTQEYKYASYLDAWRKKVENIGNLNYPDEAKRKKIYGNILMTVVLQPDGRVSSIQIRKSSGHKILDDAAQRIVNLASPFAPFPKNIRQEVDELVITRTWQFVSGNRLFAGDR
ncbi:MAG: energy transducer TonB [Chromatiales bacterium]|jgi:protein TonB